MRNRLLAALAAVPLLSGPAIAGSATIIVKDANGTSHNFDVVTDSSGNYLWNNTVCYGSAAANCAAVKAGSAAAAAADPAMVTAYSPNSPLPIGSNTVVSLGWIGPLSVGWYTYDLPASNALTVATANAAWHAGQALFSGSSSFLNIQGADSSGNPGRSDALSLATQLWIGAVPSTIGSGETTSGKWAEGAHWPGSTNRRALCNSQAGNWNVAPSCAGSSGTQYYVANAPTGNDNNTGTSTGSPWATITKVNQMVGSIPSNSTISFNGGQTFSGGLVLAQPVTINSYASGQATISSGNSAACVSATNVAGVTINNIVCQGGGLNTNTTDGISFQNTGTVLLAGPTIEYSTITGYGNHGILLNAGAYSAGYNGVNVNNNIVHDNNGNVGSGTCNGWNCACIALDIYNGIQTIGSHRNVTIANNLIYNCTGSAGGGTVNGQGSWTEAAGIVLAGVNAATVQYNVIHDIGANGGGYAGGPGGFWTWKSTKLLVQFNEVYNVFTGSATPSGPDGDALDFDEAISNSVMQYNYAHDNQGVGFLACNSDGGGPTDWHDNIYQFNLGENNNTFWAGWADVAFAGGSCQNNLSGSNYFVNNTLYKSQGTTGSNASYMILTASDVIVDNNIFYMTAGSFANGGSFGSHNDWWGDAGSAGGGLAVDPQLTNPGSGGTCYTSGTPAGPQSCPSNYRLNAGSPMIGAGADLNNLFGFNVGTRDYYGNGIPNGGGSGYNIGADGGSP